MMFSITSVKYILLFIFISQTVYVRGVSVVKNETFIKTTIIDIVNDLPMKSDLYVYLKSLERFIDYCHENKRDLHIAYYISVLIINANLKNVEHFHISPSLQTTLKKVIEDVRHYLDFFRTVVLKAGLSDLQSLVDVVGNETSWIKHIKKFDLRLIPKTEIQTKEELIKTYGEWKSYYDKVFDFESSYPNPELSDRCLRFLGKHPINNTALDKCQVSEPCYALLEKGSNYGYGFTHRLLFLTIARFGHDCSIISQEEDDNLRDKYCAKLYNELEFNVLHNYQIPDLMMEQICLCALEGHAQFLQRAWLEDLLKFQSPHGCFSLQPLSRRDQVGNVCNVHVTSVAAAALAAIVRFLIEGYYY